MEKRAINIYLFNFFNLLFKINSNFYSFISLTLKIEQMIYSVEIHHGSCHVSRY